MNIQQTQTIVCVCWIFEISMEIEKCNVIMTGAAGFIGTNIAKYLSEKGHRVIAVDYLRPEDEIKKKNLAEFNHEKYYGGGEFLELVKKDALPQAYAIIHLGACSDTRETDKKYLMRNN